MGHRFRLRKASNSIWVKRPMKNTLYLSFLLMACQTAPSIEDRGLLSFELNDSTTADFFVTQFPDYWEIENGEEVLKIAKINDDEWKVPVFNGSFNVETKGPRLTGFWVDSLRKTADDQYYRVPFTVTKDSEQPQPSQSIQGTWGVWFGSNPSESATAQMDLWTNEERVQGTIRTPTGDYRFLSGDYRGGKLKLQTFDGAHLFLVEADFVDSTWTNGVFLSGNHYQTPWIGKPARPWEATVSPEKIKAPIDSLYVRYLDEQGVTKTHSLQPDSNRVFVVDILGTWCPNCMDEIRLLQSSINQEEHDVLSVAFERPAEPNKALLRIEDYKAEMNIKWPVIWGGKADKQHAADAFPFLEKVISFPTTLFIHHDGTVYVHSGFNGPATGHHHQAEQAVFASLLRSTTFPESR